MNIETETLEILARLLITFTRRQRALTIVQVQRESRRSANFVFTVGFDPRDKFQRIARHGRSLFHV